MRKILKSKTEDEIISSMKDMNPNDLLIQSVDNGFKKGVEYALENGADINSRDIENGFTPLHYACDRYDKIDLEIIKLLVDNGADVNAETESFYTPLDKVWGARRDVVNYLRSKGGNYNMENNENEIDLYYDR